MEKIVGGVTEFFGLGGPFADIVPGYRPRPGQVAMAEVVERAFRGRHHAIVEGPTGTGKSLAYLVPAALAGIRTVIATANIALQEQLIKKDLPALNRAMGGKLNFAMLKGRQNYLCLDRWDKANDEDPLGVAELADWASETCTGDMSELDFIPESRLWSKVSVTADECKGRKCSRYRDCFSNQARWSGKNAQIIVTNYHYLFADALTGGAIIPPYGALVMDEAHKAADIARDFFGAQVREGTVPHLGRLGKKMGGNLERLVDRALMENSVFFGKLRHLKKTTYKIRFRSPGVVPGGPFAEALIALADAYGAAAAASGGDADLSADFAVAEVQVRKVAATVSDAMALKDPAEVVYFLEESKDRITLTARRIKVGPTFQELLYKNLQVVVATSATLTTGDPTRTDAFNYIATDLGMTPAETAAVESPFDHRANTLVVVPESMPEPGDPSFSVAVAAAVADVVTLARGRTLGLFTSYRNLDRAAQTLRTTVVEEDLPYRVFVQGDAPRTKLTDQFRADTSSVLLGTESFWAGVDVQGESLSCVVIDRLPFPSPEDPVLDALSAVSRDTFQTYSIPRAIIQFKQGYGRLIRTTTDRGVIVVLDTRLLTKGYGKSFLRSLPAPSGYSRDLQSVEDFLAPAAVEEAVAEHVA